MGRCVSRQLRVEEFSLRKGEHSVARKSKSLKPGTMPPKLTKLPTLPFSMGDRGAYIRKPWVAVEALGREAVSALYYEFSQNRVCVSAVLKNQIDFDATGAKPFYVDYVNSPPVTRTHLQWLKTQALNGGATPDAIRLLRKAVGLTKKEEAEMAEKLKKKASAKATKTKPVGGGGKIGKKGGNPEALERARAAAAARNAENHAKKITIKVTKKDMGAEDFKLRGGRLAKLAWVVENKPKTVGDAVGQVVKDDKGEEHKIDMGALRGMEKRGHIAIG